MSKPTMGLRRAGIASVATGALALSGVALGAGAANADADFEFSRLAGDNRYETAGDVYDAFGDNDSVILANGEQGHFPDALVANYLAGVEGSPILLTRSDKMPAATESRLDGGGKTITIVGGEDVVSAEQAAALEAEGHTVERLAGSNRYLTAAEVIEEGGDAASNTAIITTGVDFPDALAAGPVSVDQGSPIAISRADDIRDEEVDALVASGVENFIVLGGPTIVGPAVVAELEAAGLEFNERIFGADRAATSVELAEYAIANYGFSDDAVNVASGYIAGTGADALAGGPLTGQQVRPMLITRSNTNPGDSVLAFLSENCPTLEQGIIFGGPGAVDAATEAEMEEAAQTCAAAGATERPELVDAEILDTNTAGELGTDGTTVEFTFDEDVATATNGTPPNPALFHVYAASGAVESGDSLISVSGDTVQIRFEGTGLDTDAEAGALTVATVDFNAVEDAGGAESPEGDAPLGSTTGGGTQTLPAGITDGPDLVTVGSFTNDAGNTEVAFTFDEAADLAGTAADYHLIPTNGGAPISGASVDGGNGTTTHIVQFTGVINAADYARGTVDAGAVDDTSSSNEPNVLQAADVSNSGNTVDADLVSVTLQEGPATGEDRALFTFDENIASTGAANLFQLYKDSGAVVEGTGFGTPPINPADARQVLVLFPEGAIDRAVGGQTEAGAAVAADPVGGANEDDEIGVANTGTESGQTAGKTAGPDLTGVSVETRTNGFGTVVGVDATYTFDENIDTTPAPGDFFLYLEGGKQLTAASCEEGGASTGTTDDDNTIVCEFNNASDPDEAMDAVLGTVDGGAVDDAAGTLNPEGAEPVS